MVPKLKEIVEPVRDSWKETSEFANPDEPQMYCIEPVPGRGDEFVGGVESGGLFRCNPISFVPPPLSLPMRPCGAKTSLV